MVSVNSFNEFDSLYKKIVSGRATLREIEYSLSVGTLGDTANIVHALYTISTSIIVRKLLHDLWYEETARRPHIPWQRLKNPIVRVALASTIERMLPGASKEFLTYIRQQKDHEAYFVRAQVAVSLGLIGEQNDLPLLIDYLSDSSDYVFQSTVVGLAYMYNSGAKSALIRSLTEIASEHRRKLVREALLYTYDWVEDG